MDSLFDNYIVFKPITSEERFCFIRRMSDEVSNFVEEAEGDREKNGKETRPGTAPGLASLIGIVKG